MVKGIMQRDQAFSKKNLLNLDRCYGCFHLGCRSSACSEHSIIYLCKLVENVEEALTPLQVGAFWYLEPWSKCPKKSEIFGMKVHR